MSEPKMIKMQCNTCGNTVMRINRGPCKCGEGYLVPYYLRQHYLRVMELIKLDHDSPLADPLRDEIAYLERLDSTLVQQRIDLFAAHSRKIGNVVSKPEGVMLT